MYQVMRAPKEGGAVYTIAPTTDLGKAKHVHRSLLKARICQDLPTGLSDSPVAESVQPLEEGYDEEDLFVLVPETPKVRGSRGYRTLFLFSPRHLVTCELWKPAG